MSINDFLELDAELASLREDKAALKAEIERLLDVLRNTRASILGWQPDDPTPMRRQMAQAIGRINDVLTPNTSDKRLGGRQE